jgi:tetratricopeptide (TPR) repeat protein
MSMVNASPGGRCRVIGLPVTYGIELFKNRTRELDLIGRHLADPAIRMVTIVGRRGIGKSAMAAKVMDMLEAGSWPGHVEADPPAGLVNLSTRTSGISLERLYFDCARLLATSREAHLREVWASNRPVSDKVDELFTAMDRQVFVILLDNFEDRLHDDGRLDDAELSAFLDCLLRARRGPRLLITTQIPLRLPLEVRRFAAQVELSRGLPPAEAVALLRELDHDGRLGVAQLSDEQLLQAAVRVHGVPRALELLVGAVADDTLTLPTLQEVLANFTLRGDVVANLAQDRHRRLDAECRAVLNVLAVLRTPVQRDAVEWIMAALDPDLDVAPTLSRLVRVHLVSVERTGRSFALHPMDADLAYGEMAEHGPMGRQAVERRVADWYAHIAPARSTWRTVDDVEPHRRQFEHRVRAGDFDDAALVLGAISEWLVWQGSVMAAVSMHLTVDGRLSTDRARLAHLGGFGHVRLTGGPVADAVGLFAEATELAQRLDDRSALRNATFGLGDAYRQVGRPDEAIGPLARARDVAREIDDAEGEAHAILSLSLAHSYLGDGQAALTGAERLRELARTSGGRLTEARSWNARSLALLVLGRWEEAIVAGASAIRAYAAAGIGEATAGAYSVQGVALVALGRLDEALAAFEAACSHASQMENPRTEGVCLFNAAWAFWADGQYAHAAEVAERAKLSLSIAGAAEAAAARALAEAATALAAADPQAAAAGLRRSASALGGTPWTVRPAWLVTEAQRLCDDAASG